MKNLILIVLLFNNIVFSKAQNSDCIKCTSGNYQFCVDTNNFFFTRQHIMTNTIDTGFICMDWGVSDLICGDTLIVYFELDPAPNSKNFNIVMRTFQNNQWQRKHWFSYYRDDWERAGKFWHHKVYTRASDYKLLSVNLFQWRETSMKGDRTGKEVWEYVDQLDFDTGEVVRVSSTRIE